MFTAIGDPLRRDLLEKLAKESPKTATQLAELFPITRQGVLKHLNALQEAGLVTVRISGREKRYFLTPEPLSVLSDWAKSVGDMWDERLPRLKEMLENERKA
ncbi:ArsR/SmtB family transcription factor [Cohnella herbarum]|uniref:ArsR/SmtB family transcription factor n=1 Tax=Cohnella herbarum TaxID=2728023 RepID=UPI00210F5652|nr:winged helix-turn-helix domain-containing protein [Cohnella herbarum]